jgi:hypothetical protein
MKTDLFSVILVHATSHALRAEKLIKQAGISCRLIPAPRRLSSDCGVCVRVKQADRDTAVQVLADNHVDTEGIHDIELPVRSLYGRK